MYLEVKGIKFSNHKEAIEFKNYPESGFYLTEIEDGNIDLRFVDKSTKINMCICPKSMFDGINKIDSLPQEKEEKKSANEEFLNGIIDGFLDGTYINSSLLEKLK